MGSFGGFFNYEKPGPGVGKDGPKKRSFFVFFEIFFKNFWKLAFVSLIYSVISIFLLPSGLAEAGIANVARNIARDKHSFGISDFFDTIKKNWKQALPAGIINLLVTSLLCGAMYFYFMSDGWFSVVAFGVSVACFIIFSFMKYHVWLLIITFKLPLGKIYKNSFLFVFINLKRNLLITLSAVLCYGAIIGLASIPVVIAGLLAGLLAICVAPGFINLVIQYNIFPAVKKHMIDPYYEAHPGEDVELRRNLGLNIEEEDDAVFDDTRLLKEEKK